MKKQLQIKFFLILVLCLFSQQLAFTRAEKFSIKNQTPPANPFSGSNASAFQTLDELKWGLWDAGVTRLRGANIHQKKNTDGEFCVNKNTGANLPLSSFFPNYEPEDFQSLAAWKANYVNLSVPGIYTENSNARGEYLLDDAALKNLDRLLELAERADLFVVISFRTGPERTEEVFNNGGKLSVLFKDSDWRLKPRAKKAQIAWEKMWQFTAQRYKGRTNVVGYDLMVEPETKDAGQWSKLAGRLIKAIRDDYKEGDKSIPGDKGTPVLVGGPYMSDINGLEDLQLDKINPQNQYKNLIFTVHQYEPSDYAHQTESDDRAYDCKTLEYTKGELNPTNFKVYNNFPGELAAVYARIKKWRDEHPTLPVAVNEFGVVRWAGSVENPDGDVFLAEQYRILENMGINHAIWKWDPQCCIGDDDLNFRHGQDYKKHTEVDNPISAIIKTRWASGNNPIIRPSDFANR